jgi:hypothetical protein
LGITACPLEETIVVIGTSQCPISACGAILPEISYQVKLTANCLLAPESVDPFNWKLAASFTGRVMKELQSLNLTIPQSILLRTDEVIR